VSILDPGLAATQIFMARNDTIAKIVAELGGGKHENSHRIANFAPQ
jgi:hypothetical protein